MEKQQQLVLTYEEWINCLIDAQDDETKERMEKLVKQRNEEKLKILEKTKQQKRKQYIEAKRQNINGTWIWFGPLATLFCFFISYSIWDTNMTFGIFSLFVGFLALTVTIISSTKIFGKNNNKEKEN